MSIPFEKIVLEDLNTGLGTVPVSMPGGGSATGTQLGIHSFTTRGMWNVVDFGADPMGLLDSASAFNAAILKGGICLVPPGSYQIGSPITVNNPVIVQGFGPGGYGQGVIPPLKYTNLFAGGPNLATLDFFHVNSGGVVIDSLAFQGHGLRQGSGLGACIVQGLDGTQSFGNIYRNLLCSGHGVAIHIVNGTTWHIEDCDLSAFDTLIIENQGNVDSGDAFIRDCTFHATGIGGGPTGSCLKLLSGGGLKVSGCKFLSCLNGINVQWASGQSIGPLITECSFEGFTQSGILLHCSTFMVNTAIHGNFIDMLVAGGLAGIMLTGAGTISTVISANTLRCAAAPAAGVAMIDVQDADTTNVVANVLNGVGIGPIGVRIRNATHNSLVAVNMCSGCVSNVQVDAGASNVNVAFQP